MIQNKEGYMVKINCEGISNKFISSKKDVKYNISNSFTKILNSEKSEAMKRNEEILNKKNKFFE